MQGNLQGTTLDVVSAGRMVFGCGTVGRIGDLAGDVLGDPRRVLLVSDPGVRAAGVTERVQAVLEAAGLVVELFAGVAPNATIADVEAGSALITGTDDSAGGLAVVAVGGGSVIDAGKAIALHARNAGHVMGLQLTAGARRPGLPLLAVPTTAGTGAETNAFAVITDPDTGRKGYVGDPSVRPRAAVLDPELTVGLPAGPTAATGIDALTHALESLMSRNANPYAEALCLQSLRMISGFLPVAVSDAHNLEARSQMLLASHLAGLAMASGTGLGLCHALAHPIGARFGAAHGVALAAVLPHVLRFNLPASEARLALAAASLGVSGEAATQAGQAAAAVAAVEALVRTVLPPVSLTALGVTQAELPVLAQDALDDAVLANTPRTPSRNEVRRLLVAAL